MDLSTVNPARRALVENRLSSIRRQLEALSPPSEFTLEIGSGHGHFLNAYAAAHPQRYCIGIDIILDRLDRSERKRSRAALRNLAFIRAEASDFLTALPAEFRLSEVFILFPDPWPKRRHHKHRLLQPSFLTALARRCTAGTRLYFRTDHDDYFASARDVVAQHPDWQIAPTATWPFELPTVFQIRAPSFQSLIAFRVSDQSGFRQA